MERKVCKNCNIEKDVVEFNKNSGRVNSYRTICKPCYNDKYREQTSKANNEYKKNNREKINFLSREYKKNNKDKYLKYKEENKDKIKKKDALWFQNNKEKIYAKISQRRKTDKRFKASLDLRNLLWRIVKHKVQKTYDLLGYNTNDFLNRFGADIDRFNEMGVKYNIDHKIPISWFEDNVPISIVNNLDNLQIIAEDINHEKNNGYSCLVSTNYFESSKDFIKEDKKNFINLEQK